MSWLFDITLLQAIGIIGTALYVFSFLAVQMMWLDGDGWGYPSANVLGAVLILGTLSAEFNIATLLINVLFLGLGLRGLWSHQRRYRAARRAPEAEPQPTPGRVKIDAFERRLRQKQRALERGTSAPQKPQGIRLAA